LQSNQTLLNPAARAANCLIAADFYLEPVSLDRNYPGYRERNQQDIQLLGYLVVGPFVRSADDVAAMT
jgi:hypothetical protein